MQELLLEEMERRVATGNDILGSDAGAHKAAKGITGTVYTIPSVTTATVSGQ